jgi:hypothetical protein
MKILNTLIYNHSNKNNFVINLSLPMAKRQNIYSKTLFHMRMNDIISLKYTIIRY